MFGLNQDTDFFQEGRRQYTPSADDHSDIVQFHSVFTLHFEYFRAVRVFRGPIAVLRLIQPQHKQATLLGLHEHSVGQGQRLRPNRAPIGSDTRRKSTIFA